MEDEIKGEELDGVSDDDPEVEDETPDNDEPEETEEKADESGEETAEKPEDKPEDGSEDKKPETSKVIFTPEQQAYVDRLIGDRLARERQVRDKELQAATGKTLDQLKAEAKAARVEELQTLTGMDEGQAADIAEKEARLREFEARQEELRQQQEAMKAVTSYQQGKAKLISDPWAKKFEAEIDEFAQGGLAGIDFETAMNYVIGQKLRSGEVLKDPKRVVEQKVIRDIEKRGRVAPVTASGSPQTVSLSAQEREMAANLGLTAAEYAAEKARIQKAKRNQ